MIGIIVAAALQVPHTVSISELELSRMTSGWGKAAANKSITGTELSIGGHRFLTGVGTHASSRFKIALDGHAVRFRAVCGVDDNAKAAGPAIVFRILLDRKPVWTSRPVALHDAGVPVDISVEGAKRLLLEVDSSASNVDFCHADWAGASIDYLGQKPVAFVPPPSIKRILTPPPSEWAQIVGPHSVGARPGHPFLYRIPATGLRPMRFLAMDLPRGLSVDPVTGIIQGSVADRGRYSVTLYARNRKNASLFTLMLVVGDKIALTPPMGWNSWYVWESRVTDKIVRDAAKAMVRSGMAQHGWQYVNIDDCWARMPSRKDSVLGGPTREPDGTLRPNRRFPSMTSLTAYIHSLGLKAGIYTSPGPTTCAGYEGAYKHEKQDADTFVRWGFDFLKYDWCSYHAANDSLAEFKKPYQKMGDILKKEPRDVVYNLCQYGMSDVWKWGAAVGGNCWRTAGDLGVGFTLYADGMDLYSRAFLDKYAKPGEYNDPDYLLLGKIADWHGGLRDTPLTPDEQYTQVTLWCLLAAPLIFSGDMTHLDPFTLSLLTNDEVIAVDQDVNVEAAKRVSSVDQREVWARPLNGGKIAVGLFNRDDEPQRVSVTWKQLHLADSHVIRDLWRQKDLGRSKYGYSAIVPGHGAVLVSVW